MKTHLQMGPGNVPGTCLVCIFGLRNELQPCNTTADSFLSGSPWGRRATLWLALGRTLNARSLLTAGCSWWGWVGRGDFFQKQILSARGNDHLPSRGAIKSMATEFKRRDHFSIIASSCSPLKDARPTPPVLSPLSTAVEHKRPHRNYGCKQVMRTRYKLGISACANRGYNRGFIWLHFLLSI